MSQSPLRLGIVGCGNVTIERHIPAVNRLDGAQVVAVTDPVEARATSAREAANLNQSQSFASFGAMVEDSQLDYVLITVPPSIRLPIVEYAFERGLDVLTEKPLATRPSEAAQMARLARSLGRKFGMVHNYLYFPEYQMIHELIDQGEVGDLQFVVINLLGIPDFPGNADFRPRWRHDVKAAGGGVLMDLIHVFYLAEFLMDDQIAGVGAIVDNFGPPEEQVEDFVLTHLYFPNSYAAVNLSWSQGPGGLEVTGSKGRIMAFYEDFTTGPFSTFDELTLVNDAGKMTYRPRQGQEVIGDTFDAIHQDFVEAITLDRDPVATAEDGARTLQAALAAYTAGLTGRRVLLPLDEDDPVFIDGVIGLRNYPSEEADRFSNKSLFGIEAIGETP